MLVKEQIVTELNSLGSPELFRIYEYVLTMKQVQKIQQVKKIKNSHYLKVREALKNLKTSLSQTIIEEREDRV